MAPRQVMRAQPLPSSDGTDLVYKSSPHRRLKDLTLPASVSVACEELLEEQRGCDKLRSHGLEPRHRVLLSGPPGNGKTSLADVLAGELDIPLLSVRYDALIQSYLGSTSTNIARIFDHVRKERCVVFFDEFEAVGSERDDKQELGEMKRIVSSLLLNIDSLPSTTIIVTATNHPELLDRAVWRRFQLRLDLPPPTTAIVAQLVARFEVQQQVKLGGPLKKKVLSLLTGKPFSEIEEFLMDVRRRLVLSSKSKPDEVVQARVEQWRNRCSSKPEHG